MFGLSFLRMFAARMALSGGTARSMRLVVTAIVGLLTVVLIAATPLRYKWKAPHPMGAGPLYYFNDQIS